MANDRWVSIKGTRQLDGIIRWTRDGLQDSLNAPRVMVPFIHSFGRASFTPMAIDESGQRDWQPLSRMTQDTREARGYNPSHPVLEQSGGLKSLAKTPFMKWGPNTRRSTRSDTAPYDDGNHLKMVATNQSGIFRATITGQRVQNQYGGRISDEKRFGTRDRYRSMFLPKRQFWGMHMGIINEGMKSFWWVLLDEWRNNAKGFHVR